MERGSEAVVAVEAQRVGARLVDLDVERPVGDHHVGRADRRADRDDLLVACVQHPAVEHRRPRRLIKAALARPSEIGRRTMPGTKVLLGIALGDAEPRGPGVRFGAVPGGATSGRPSDPAPSDPARNRRRTMPTTNSAPAPARRWRREIDIVASVGVAGLRCAHEQTSRPVHPCRSRWRLDHRQRSTRPAATGHSSAAASPPRPPRPWRTSKAQLASVGASLADVAKTLVLPHRHGHVRDVQRGLRRGLRRRTARRAAPSGSPRCRPAAPWRSRPGRTSQ